MENPAAGDAWTRVFTDSPTDADLARSVLEGSGVSVVTERLGGGAFGLGPGPLGVTALFVKADDAASAKEVLGHGEADDGDFSLLGGNTSHLKSVGVWLLRLAILAVLLMFVLDAIR